MKDIKAATKKALEQLQLAQLPVEAARATLAEALGIDPETRPNADTGKSQEEWQATRLMQNIWSAHLHITDPFGS